MFSTARRSVAVLVLGAAFTVVSAGVANAVSYTVIVPGTVATKPCTTTTSADLDTTKPMPVIVKASTTCTV